MEFKKCVRCGCFFISNNEVCYNCESKDKLDIAKLNTIIDESITTNSIEELSFTSGVSINNLNRFIKNKDFNGLKNINL